jgi:rhamnose utilization protein RhaD (predicted bifunctional aldolase and dehydrogenase)
MKELSGLIKISRFAGKRSDLVQAGGGNSSVKIGNGMMIIKSSGCRMEDVSANKCHVTVDRAKILALLRLPRQKIEKRYESFIKGLEQRPSMEMFLHALLKKYVLHTHPISVNALVCRKDWQRVIKKLFPGAMLVKYRTPGIELALEMERTFKTFFKISGKYPEIIFLQNHGLIISSNSPDKVISITENVNRKALKFLCAPLHALMKKRTSELLKLMKTELKPLTPDMMVYCGHAPELRAHKGKASNEVLRALLLSNLVAGKTKLVPLTNIDCLKISRMSSEKYRIKKEKRK